MRILSRHFRYAQTVSGNYKKMIDFNKIWVDFSCPKCNYTDKVQLIDVKYEKIFFCNNCKIKIQLTDDQASVHSGIDRMSKSLNDLEKTLKNFGK